MIIKSFDDSQIKQKVEDKGNEIIAQILGISFQEVIDNIANLKADLKTIADVLNGSYIVKGNFQGMSVGNILTQMTLYDYDGVDETTGIPKKDLANLKNILDSLPNILNSMANMKATMTNIYEEIKDTNNVSETQYNTVKLNLQYISDIIADVVYRTNDCITILSKIISSEVKLNSSGTKLNEKITYINNYINQLYNVYYEKFTTSAISFRKSYYNISAGAVTNASKIFKSSMAGLSSYSSSLYNEISNL